MSQHIKKANKKRKADKKHIQLRLLLLVLGIIMLNILAFKLHTGFDLTSDHRYTLSQPTVQLLKRMDDVASVTVFLKGDFPAGFRKLAQTTEEQLTAFKQKSDGNLVFKFEDPFEGKSSASEKEEVYQYLQSKGVSPMNLQRKDIDEGYSEQIIFPWALVQYKGSEMAVPLLENYMGLSPQDVLNKSESLLEYKFANAIHTLSGKQKARVAYLTGNEQPLNENTEDLLLSVGDRYVLDTLDLNSNYYLPSHFQALIVNRPQRAFTEQEKFKLDQYVMRGGNILWAVDVLHAPMDSLQGGNQAFITSPIELNIEDLLFKFGARINNNFIEDLNCNPIPITAGMKGNQPNIELRPWIYFPILQPASSHPIVKNMDGVMSVYTSSIDTIATPGIKKTILLHSSEYSRTTPAPVRVSLSILAFQPKLELFNKPYQAAAVLLEGKFESLFSGRIAESFKSLLSDSLNQAYHPSALREGKQIVLSDADILANDFSTTRGVFEMGYWRYTDYRFANKAFVLNCLEYLTDPDNLLEARNKDRKLRLLDAGRVKRESSKWAGINIVVPVALVLIFASIYLFFRKRRYESAPTNVKK